MKASEIMTRDVVTTTPECSIDDLARLMTLQRVSGVPVVDAGGAVVGIVTEGDLLRRVELGTEKPHSRWLSLLIAPGRLAQEYAHSHARQVGEVMTSAVVTVEPETLLAEVVALMESRGVKRLPVVDRGKLVGIVSRADLLKALSMLVPNVSAPAVSDAEIRARILAELDRLDWTPRTGIDAIVRDGSVELCGVITDERQREGLRVAAENVPGVKRVVDHLLWVEPISGLVVEPPDERASS